MFGDPSMVPGISFTSNKGGPSTKRILCDMTLLSIHTETTISIDHCFTQVWNIDVFLVGSLSLNMAVSVAMFRD
jgi:hypothetical protein